MSGYDKSPDYGGPDPGLRGVVAWIVVFCVAVILVGWLLS